MGVADDVCRLHPHALEAHVRQPLRQVQRLERRHDNTRRIGSHQELAEPGPGRRRDEQPVDAVRVLHQPRAAGEDMVAAARLRAHGAARRPVADGVRDRPGGHGTPFCKLLGNGRELALGCLRTEYVGNDVVGNEGAGLE